MNISGSYIDDFPVFFSFNSCNFHHCPGFTYIGDPAVYNISCFQDIWSNSVWLYRDYSGFSVNEYITRSSRIDISCNYCSSISWFELLCSTDKLPRKNKASFFKVFFGCYGFCRRSETRGFPPISGAAAFLGIGEFSLFVRVSSELVF